MRPYQPITALIITIIGLALASVGLAGEQTVTLRDFTGRGFAPDLVEYRVPGNAARRERLRVFDAKGQLIPSQVRQDAAAGAGVLQFVTALPVNGVLDYTIRDTGGKRAEGGVTAAKAATTLELGNGLFTVRVPGEIKKTFKPPVAAATLPAPILAFRHGNGAWLGKSAILSQKTVESLRVQLVARGPVCAELAYEIRWAGGGYYRATLQVIDQVPLVKVREEFDMTVLDGTHFWELDLGQGWQPDRVQATSHNGNGGGDPVGRIVDFTTLMDGQPVQYIVGDQAWGKLSYISLFNEADSKATPAAYPLVGVVPLRKGLWRRSNALEVRSENAHDLRVRFPLGARNAEWGRDITSETSPFSTLEHEPGLSKTYGRRVWGLALGHPAIPDPMGTRPVYQLQCLYGIIGLDRYKDYILDWTDGKPAYPRLYKNTKAATEAEATRCLTTLRQLCQYYFTTTHSSHHYTSANYLLAAQAEAALTRPELPAETRKDIRACLALLAYIYEDADMMSYANGHHHGNPNMGTARFWSGPCFMTLLPDHPQFTAWRDHMAQYGAYNISTQMAPGGGYFEFGAAYHMHGFARTTNGLPGLQSAGANVADLLTNYVAPDWRYYMNLLTPYDSRWRSRMIPGMANSEPGNTENLLEAAGTLADSNPELAANLRWAWEANGSKGGANLALAPANITPVEPKLTSQLYPGVGVIFRAHQGPQETYMLLRAGFEWSHWVTDPGHFILCSKGAVLVPYQPYQYYDSDNAAFDLNNTMRFGHPENTWPYGWGDSTVLDHAFGASVDYAWASTGFPEWYIKPGVSPTWQNTSNVPSAGARKLDATPNQVEGAFEWSRQVLFMKGKTAASPNYFVFRDSMPGEGKLASYLYLNLLGTRKDITTHGGHIAVETEWPTKLDVLFAQPTAVTPDIHEQRLPLAFHNANLNERVGAAETISPNWVKQDGSKWEGVPTSYQTQENHVMLRIPGAPGAGYFWVLYPRTANEPAPQISVLADGVMKITHPEGTDYVFLGSSPVSYTGEGVVFQGRAGAVRLDGDSVVLVKAGGEGKVGYKGRIIAGTAPVEQRITLAQLAAGETTAAALAGDVTLPAAATAEQQLAPGVSKATLDNGITRYRLASGAETVRFAADDVRLEGSAAVVEITDKRVRFIAGAGQYVKLSVGARGVRGVGPFDLTLTDTGITGTVAGDTRSLVVTWPAAIVRPMFRMDGVRYYAGWADDQSIGKGTTTPQFSLAFGVTPGRHTIDIAEWTYPRLPPEPAKREVVF